jgi:uncharacterized protein
MPEIAIFPLRTVLFPGGTLPLKVFEQRYLDMTKVCLRDGEPFGVCLIREGVEVGTPALPYAVGCTARIAEWDMPHLGLFQLNCRGEQAFRILEHWTLKSGLLQAHVQMMNSPAPLALPSEHQSLKELLERIIGKFGAERFPAPIQLDDGDWVACRLGDVLPLDMEFKQALLEASGPLERLGMLSEFLRSRSVVV